MCLQCFDGFLTLFYFVKMIAKATNSKVPKKFPLSLSSIFSVAPKKEILLKEQTA